jgi:nitroimidazol reductase NimA-like FMN-containing flavoprotein (pyridoxamine 5'-phosphate oxidase superfamily)
MSRQYFLMADATQQIVESQRSTLRRKRERGTHDRRVVEEILDAGLVCHVGFNDQGSTFVVPTAYARVGDSLLLHGAAANYMLKSIGSGIESCVTVTLLDGLVLARSAFHHSINYRSVMLFGTATRVEQDNEKLAAVLAILDHIVPGRGADARPPTPEELRATSVLRFPIDEGSSKVRIGGPIDDPEDESLPIWAGQLPIEQIIQSPIPDPNIPAGVVTPPYVLRHQAGGRVEG